MEEFSDEAVWITGPNPRQANGTKAVIKMKEDKNATFRPDEFGAVLVDQDGDKVTLKVSRLP